MNRGFVLRDASECNAQFPDARPNLIDTLSLGRYREGEPWAAYKRFCEHFLVPLALMSIRDSGPRQHVIPGSDVGPCRRMV